MKSPALSAPFSSDARSHRCRGGAAARGAARRLLPKVTSLRPPLLSLSPPLPPPPPPPPRFGAGAATGIGGKSRGDRARLGQRELGGRGKPVFGKRGQPVTCRRPLAGESRLRSPAGSRREAPGGGSRSRRWLLGGSVTRLPQPQRVGAGGERLPPPAGNPASPGRRRAASHPSGDPGSPASHPRRPAPGDSGAEAGGGSSGRAGGAGQPERRVASRPRCAPRSPVT